MSLTEEEHRERRSLSVEEAISEAMNTQHTPDENPDRSTSLPEPHLPLRKASAQKRRAGHAPRPLFAPSEHQAQQQQEQQQNHHSHHHHLLRGFNPSPVQPAPYIDNTPASSEHAFAGRDTRQPSKLALPSMLARHEQPDERVALPERSSSSLADTNSDMNRPPSSPLLPPPTPKSPHGKRHKLKGSRSFGDSLRGLRHRMSSKSSIHFNGRATPDSLGPPGRPSTATDEIRQSYRSIFTSHSSGMNTSSVNTELSSVATNNSESSEFVKVFPNWPDTSQFEGSARGSMTNESVIGMYAEGFGSPKQSMDTAYKRSMQTERPSFHSARPSSQPSLRGSSEMKRPALAHRRSQSASLLNQWKPTAEQSLAPPPSHPTRTSADIIGNGTLRLSEDRRSEKKAPEQVPRDRYGFKKTSHYISVQQYDAWNAVYSEHLSRRSKKWHALMRSYGLATKPPFRFPPKSDKIKRYVRKGIPPEFRGAAWFWYAGGPGRLAKEPGLYFNLLQQIKNGGKLSDNDREHIERDLNRTFPDNIRFKPDPATMSDAQAGAGGGTAGTAAGKQTKGKNNQGEPETPMIQSLRRVLQAFAVHNPGIGYCQSLNFIAGLLLLFLDEDEEKAFVLLEIVTSVHLPGTHGIALEGANIDIAVLMSCIKDSLPGVWAKLDDKGGGLAGDPSAQALRLPTVSLATTAWFMSLFVGTLPIESVLRVWDCLFFEGSKTLFRIALAIFKAGEKEIMAVHDPMEIFQVVQTSPRGMLDINSLLEVCFRRRGGFGHVSQDLIERRRAERRRAVKEGVSTLDGSGGVGAGVARWKSRWRSRTKI
ncbi:RabGAP/TBC [Hortaea werneckii]|nr:RabGAP/TBC [Hortaea werneckii]